jgi:hypothetical protein
MRLDLMISIYKISREPQVTASGNRFRRPGASRVAQLSE